MKRREYKSQLLSSVAAIHKLNLKLIYNSISISTFKINRNINPGKYTYYILYIFSYMIKSLEVLLNKLKIIKWTYILCSWIKDWRESRCQSFPTLLLESILCQSIKNPNYVRRYSENNVYNTSLLMRFLEVHWR